MAFLVQLVTVSVVVTLITAFPTKESQEDKQDTSYDSYQLPKDIQIPTELQLPKDVELPTNLQLPKAEAAAPFFTLEPSPVLSAPQYYSNAEKYYDIPIPAQELRAPTETVWNPNNDPKYYYEIPAILTKQQLPTKQFPKKYNKDLHSKEKPYGSKPKQEIVLQPIDEKQFQFKQKHFNKAFDNLEKIENKKNIQVLNFNKELKTAETGFDHGFNSDGSHAKLTDSFAFTSPHSSSSNGERLNFHMVGHDGPHSYKFGFDTGKGHNRQFRYEERDKEGIVKGHYGFYDKRGKLQMVNYDAFPYEGFHAEGNFGKY